MYHSYMVKHEYNNQCFTYIWENYQHEEEIQFQNTYTHYCSVHHDLTISCCRRLNQPVNIALSHKQPTAMATQSAGMQLWASYNKTRNIAGICVPIDYIQMNRIHAVIWSWSNLIIIKYRRLKIYSGMWAMF